MKINYEDEYQVNIFTADSDVVPGISARVVLADEEWHVTAITFYPEHNSVVVSITQNLVKQQDKSADTSLKETHRAIANIRSRQEVQEKKNRVLTEQLVSLRTYLKSQQRKPQ